MFPVHFEQGLLLIYESGNRDRVDDRPLSNNWPSCLLYIVRPTKNNNNNNNSYNYKQIDDQDDEED